MSFATDLILALEHATAGQAIARLQREGLGALAGQRAPVDGVADADVAAALKALADAAAA